jgi:hypothetical protein
MLSLEIPLSDRSRPSLRRSSNRNHGIEPAARSHEGSKQLSNGLITSTRRGVTGMLDY